MKYLKQVRVGVSLISILLLALAILDFRQQMPGSTYKWLTWLQFVPSLRSFLIAFSVLSAGFLIVLLLTLFVGRVYCSTVCPLGIFQDFISFFSRKFKLKKSRYKFAKPKNYLRYTFLVITLIPVIVGSIIGLIYLDPYSNFGRIFSDLIRPVYILLNNGIAHILIKFNIYVISPEEIAKQALITIIYPVLILVIIVWLAYKWGRLYCNTICPVGTFLGIISRFSFFRININKTSCNQCAQCSFVCKSQCISIKKQTVDVSRCVGCFNCIKSCERNSITYVPFWKIGKDEIHKNNEGTREDESKRKFILTSLTIVGVLAGFTRKTKAETKELKYRENLTPVKKDFHCSPPGSKSIVHFNDACTACHLCVTACPNKVLQPSVLEYGLTGFLQPFMDATQGYCNFECTKCSEVCPTGAILPLTKEEKKLTQIGKVVFLKENCVVYTDETLCGACSEHCPTKAVHMIPYKEKLNIPEVNNEICVGCSACEHACPVRPHRAIYVNGNPKHLVAKKPKIEKLKEEKLEDFPF